MAMQRSRAQHSRLTRPLSMTGGAASPAVRDESSKSTMTQSVFNLVKNIMGAGMLSLPAGVAVFSDSKSAIAPASAIIAVFGIISAYTFSLIGRSCSDSKAESYKQSWARTVSPATSALPAGACVATCLTGCLAYTIIIGDTFSALAQTFGIGGALATRSNIIGSISVAVLLPLALLKNLSALGFTSMLGTGGLIYTAAMMGLRYFDGSYRAGGKFFAALTAANRPVFGTKAPRPILFLVLVSMLGTAYEAHYNAPLFYRELQHSTIPRYNKMVYTSFFLSIITMTLVTAFGFLTFGGSSNGFILNNYARSDVLATWARVFVGISIVFSYPFVFIGLRDGLLEMRGITRPTERQRTSWTVGLVALMSAIALKVSDLGFLNTFCGALMASGIIYVFPALMFLSPLRRKVKEGAAILIRKERMEVLANYGVIGLGVAVGALGAIISVLEAFFPTVLAS